MSAATNKHSPKESLEAANRNCFGGRFLIERLGRDDPNHLIGFGVDRSTGESVVLQSGVRLLRGAIVRLEHEANALKDVKSDYLYRMIDASFDGDAAVIIDSFVDGTPLNRIVAGAPISAVRSINLAMSLLSALRDMHHSGVHHLDVRPEKLIVQEDESARLVRRTFSSRCVLETQLNDPIWRASFMSPEQAGSIERDVAAPADLYSVGAILFYMLTGRPPFVANDVSSILLAHMTSPVPNFLEHNIEIPRVLEQLVRRLLGKDPSDRYQTADAVLYDLTEIQASLKAGIKEPQLVIGSQDDRATLIEPAFLGRDDELSVILDQMTHARSGRGSLVFLEGESGSGKSRLLVEVYQRAVANGFRLYRSEGTNEVGRGALSLLNGVADDLVSAAQNDPSLQAEFLKAFDEDASCLVSVLPRLGQIVDVDQDMISGPEDFVETRTVRTLCSFLNALGCAHQPAFVILDDCQWADDQTYKLLKRWAEQNNSSQNRSHVILLLAFRAEEVSEDHQLRALQPSAHVRLADLKPADVRSLAESMAGVLPERAIELIIDAASGSPFMAAAIARGLVESEAIVHGVSGWEINESAFSDCQSSNHAGEFLTRRLNSLPEATLSLLTIAAVLGKAFDLDSIADLADLTPTAAMHWFSEARQKHMVWVRGEANQGVFSHDKIREALLSRLPPAQLRTIHFRAAEYLAAKDDLSAVEIAFHFDAAGEAKRALPYAIKAAEEARRQSALVIAKELYLIAERESASSDRETVFRIKQNLGDVLMLLGEYGPAEERFREGVQLAQGKTALAGIQGQLAENGRKRGDLECAITNYEAALNTLGHPVPSQSWKITIKMLWEVFVQILTTWFPSLFLHRKKRNPNEDERLSISLLSGIVHAYWYARGKPVTLWAHFRGLNLGEKFNPSVELANVYSEHAPAISLLGMHERAYRYSNKSFEIRRSFRDLWGQGQSLCYHACALYGGSKFEEAIAKGRESVRLLEQAGDYWCVHIARFQVAAALFRLGRCKEALIECEKNYESGLAVGDEQTTGVILDIWAQATDGRVPADVLQPELIRKRIDMQARCQVLMAEAINLTRIGEVDDALKSLEEGIRVINEAGISNCYTLPVYFWRTRALRMKAEKQEAALSGMQRIETLRQAFRSGIRAVLESWMCKNDLPRILRELALIRIMQGHPRQAKWILKRSVKMAERRKMHFDYAESLRVLGELQGQFHEKEAEFATNQAKTLLGQIAVSFGIEDSDAEESGFETLSLVDRFDTILEVGRHITTALVVKDVYEQTRDASLRLLRCESCVIVEQHDDQFSIVSGDILELDREAICRAFNKGRATSGHLMVTKEAQMESTGSIICSPIYVLGKISACIYATHQGVRDLFGPTEERLANFISTISGASLENAQSYYQLQELNMTLEERVEERTKAAETRAHELALSNEELERTATDLRSTEDQLREAIKQANSANEAKSQFLANMSHELRTPMNGILGMTELLTRIGLSARQKTCVNVVRQSGENLLTLINDILDLSKIEAGKMDLEHIEFELRVVVENAVRLLSASAQKKNLEIICDINNATPRRVTGDPNRIRQILTNLIGNAIKFTTEGEILVSVRQEDEHVVFAVSDTGIGVTNEKKELIFDAFKQSDCSTTRQYGGTGLGLSICRTLVELMGGTIAVDSKPSEGSTFRFRIPFEETTANQFDLGKDELRGLLAALVCQNATASSARQHMLECLGLSVMSFETLSELTSDDIQEFNVLLIDEVALDFWKKRGLATNGVIAITRALTQVGQGVVQVSSPPVLEELADAIETAINSHSSPNASVATTRANKKGFRILVADDSLVNQEVAAGLLQLSGHTVLVANNGREAMQSFLDHELDLILMDVEMPDIDGLEATRRIRRLERGGDIPIIALDAHALPEKKKACFDAGVNAYVAKPFQPDDLLDTISTLVQESRNEIRA